MRRRAPDPAIPPPPRSFFTKSDGFRLVCTLFFVPVVWLFDAPRATRMFVIAWLLADHVICVALEHYEAKHPNRATVAFLPALSAITAFVFSQLSDSLRFVALFGYLALVVWVAGTARRSVTFGTAALVSVLAIVREFQVEPASDRLSPVVLVWFVMCALVCALFISALRMDATRSERTLARVMDAMKSVSTSPELDPTLDSIVNAATRAVGGIGTAVLLREADHFILAAPTFMRESWPPERVAQFTRAEIAHMRSPLATSVSTGETVVIEDLRTEERFPDWRVLFESNFGDLSVRGIVVVPLCVNAEVVGLMETLFRHPIPARDDVVRLLEAYGEQVAVVIVRAQAYERERELRAGLAEADRMKSEFLSVVSHELRTPLAAAKGFVDTVLFQWDRLPAEQRRELLARASTNAEELQRLIDQLLDYSRMERASIALDIRPTRLAPAIATVLDGLAPVLANHRVVVDIDPDLDALADTDALAHVVKNLLTNAAKFAPAGSTITISAEVEDDEVLVMVADEGPGIPLAEQDRVFERFYQSPEHRAARHGTGLGLAIARRCAEAIGGRLWVESEFGAGATFVCALRPVRLQPGLTPEQPATKLDQPV